MSPTSRSLQAARRSGYLAAVVEKWNAHAQIRQDLFGFADILLVAPHREPQRILVQATTAGHLAERIEKLRGIANVRRCIQAGFSVECWGWLRRDGRWHLRRKVITLEAVKDAGDRPRGRRRVNRQKELFA